MQKGDKERGVTNETEKEAKRIENKEMTGEEKRKVSRKKKKEK